MPDYQIGSTRLFGHRTREEFMADVAAAQDQRERTAARAWKHMALPRLTGTASGGTLIIGTTTSSSGVLVGPEQGYAWSIRRMIVSGLTSGSTPDVVNLFRTERTNAIEWQFNGNNFGYTFGRLEMVYKPGDMIVLRSTGTFNATGTITVSGELIEVPAEQLWKLD